MRNARSCSVGLAAPNRTGVVLEGLTAVETVGHDMLQHSRWIVAPQNMQVAMQSI